MSGFNFGQIKDILSEVLDTDYIDIKRDIGSELQEIYSNIPCHIAYSSIDNPDAYTVDIKPIIQSINIHLPLWVDIRNNDFIVAKKIGSNGELIATYSGRCGNPIVSQSRKKVNMSMSSTESETPTPIPPKNPVRIKVEYIYDNVSIQDSMEVIVESNSSFTLQASIIEGYSPRYCIIDNVEQDSTTAYISNVDETEHHIIFVYEVSNLPDMLRILVNGLYTKDDGSLANGYHFYKKINIDNIVKDNNNYQITCDNIKWVHEDNGKDISIKVGTKIILIPGNIFVMVDDILKIEDRKITFVCSEFIPTYEEQNAYITGWYD